LRLSVCESSPSAKVSVVHSVGYITDSVGPTDFLDELGVSVAWCQNMEPSMLWFQKQNLMVLNAVEDRDYLTSLVLDALRTAPPPSLEVPPQRGEETVPEFLPEDLWG
jgi:hypothetical protein